MVSPPTNAPPPGGPANAACRWSRRPGCRLRFPPFAAPSASIRGSRCAPRARPAAAAPRSPPRGDRKPAPGDHPARRRRGLARSRPGAASAGPAWRGGRSLSAGRRARPAIGRGAGRVGRSLRAFGRRQGRRAVLSSCGGNRPGFRIGPPEPRQSLDVAAGFCASGNPAARRPHPSSAQRRPDKISRRRPSPPRAFCRGRTGLRSRARAEPDAGRGSFHRGRDEKVQRRRPSAAGADALQPSPTTASTTRAGCCCISPSASCSTIWATTRRRCGISIAPTGSGAAAPVSTRRHSGPMSTGWCGASHRASSRVTRRWGGTTRRRC